jgi:hypothetical protein
VLNPRLCCSEFPACIILCTSLESTIVVTTEAADQAKRADVNTVMVHLNHLTTKGMLGTRPTPVCIPISPLASKISSLHTTSITQNVG